MAEFRVKGGFLCDYCRNICNGGCYEKLVRILDGTVKEGSKEYEENKDLIGRKQIIHCLGPYCSDPCELQRSEYTPFKEGDGVKPLISLINFLGQKLNDELREKYEKEE